MFTEHCLMIEIEKNSIIQLLHHLIIKHDTHGHRPVHHTLIELLPIGSIGVGVSKTNAIGNLNNN